MVVSKPAARAVRCKSGVDFKIIFFYMPQKEQHLINIFAC